MQNAINRRLEGYPDKARLTTHHARCIVPATVAHLLSTEPQLVAPAVEALYTRTPADMQAAGRGKHLPPKVCPACCWPASIALAVPHWLSN